MILSKFSNIFEIIPKTISENAGLDTTAILNNLRFKHDNNNCWNGINIENGGLLDAYEHYIWEPSMLKINAIQSAVEITCIILSIDSVFLSWENII